MPEFVRTGRGCPNSLPEGCKLNGIPKLAALRRISVPGVKGDIADIAFGLRCCCIGKLTGTALADVTPAKEKPGPGLKGLVGDICRSQALIGVRHGPNLHSCGWLL